MSKAKILYFTLQDEQTKEDKLDWFEKTRFEEIPFAHITPDQKANWIHLTDNDFDSFLPLIDKEVKAGKSQEAVFQLFSAGVKTQRDEWVYDFSREALIERMKYFVEVYQERLEHGVRRELDIKWDRELEKYLERKIQKQYNSLQLTLGLYRPFAYKYFYFDRHFNGMTYQLPSIFLSKIDESNKLIVCSDIAFRSGFNILATDSIPDLHLCATTDAFQCLPLYRYDENGNRIDNITDWALEQFRRHYGSPCPSDIPLVKGDLDGASSVTFPDNGHSSPTSLVKEDLDDASSFTSPDNQHPSTAPLVKGGSRGDQIDYATIAQQRNLPYKKGHLPYNPKLIERAKEMRKSMTQAERKLWYDFLRTFPERVLRQRPIDHFIVDFYCPDLKLVIEVDGAHHDSEEGQVTDAERTAILESYGLQVLRFTNHEVLQEFESVCQIIKGVGSPCPSDIPLVKGDLDGASSITSPDNAHPSTAPLVKEDLGDTSSVTSPDNGHSSPASLDNAHPSTAPLVKGGSRGDQITKLDIFHYTYAVLHHPAYRTQYELNLKREFPRLPFYADFHQWATWGKDLMNLHLNYETIEPYGLRRVDIGCKKSTSDPLRQATLIPIDTPDPAKPIKRTTPKAKLKADKTEGKIILDTETTLEGIPAVAWDYKLGNRSALEWILDQYKEKTPKDPTIAKLFNNYKFADYKEHVIDLLQRVCTVSVRTMKIIQQMPDTVEHKGG